MGMYKLLFIALLSITGVIFPSLSYATECDLTDKEVKQKIIDESIAAYPGTCACPFNIAADGSECGDRSAWSRPGGFKPICYEDEVSDKMIKEWRIRHNCKSDATPARK